MGIRMIRRDLMNWTAATPHILWRSSSGYLRWRRTKHLKTYLRPRLMVKTINLIKFSRHHWLIANSRSCRPLSPLPSSMPSIKMLRRAKKKKTFTTEWPKPRSPENCLSLAPLRPRTSPIARMRRAYKPKGVLVRRRRGP